MFHDADRALLARRLWQQQPCYKMSAMLYYSFCRLARPLSYHLKLAVLCIHGYTLLHDKVSCYGHMHLAEFLSQASVSAWDPK